MGIQFGSDSRADDRDTRVKLLVGGSRAGPGTSKVREEYSGLLTGL